MFIVWQNGRVLLATLLLSLFSFGVMTYILTPPTYFILGYLLSQFVIAGLDLTLFVAGIVPHGIIEIPVITIAAAAIFRLGAIITRPPAGKTVGQAWLETFGDTLKIGVGVIIPGLILAAIVETFVTFPILQAVLNR
jgi:stage II sporulation protein M